MIMRFPCGPMTPLVNASLRLHMHSLDALIFTSWPFCNPNFPSLSLAETPVCKTPSYLNLRPPKAAPRRGMLPKRKLLRYNHVERHI